MPSGILPEITFVECAQAAIDQPAAAAMLEQQA
jgi:hypothetical protein